MANSSAKDEGKRYHAGIQKLDLELSMGDRIDCRMSYILAKPAHTI
jgi:hypothetical protein